MKNKNLVFVICDGLGKMSYKNLTMASILFDAHGARTGHEVIECATWPEGFTRAQSRGYRYGLFVLAGTVFRDLSAFLKELENYPHRGLIGHIVDPQNGNNFYLDPQCFLLELDKFEEEDFLIDDYRCPIADRSQQNVHHDYTPFWLKPTEFVTHYETQQFGEGLIARQLTRGEIVVNWLQHMRANKQYLYDEELALEYLTEHRDYKRLAENQLWIFNNEPYTVYSQNERLVCPASGLYWMFHMVATNVSRIQLVDISKPQLMLASALWRQWDGFNYGDFVYDFIQEHEIQHYTVSPEHNSREERIKLKKRSYFVETVNRIFEQHCRDHGIEHFEKLWSLVQHKELDGTHGDMVTYIAHTIDQTYDLWLSNILNYKYTLLRHEYQVFEQLYHELSSSDIHVKNAS